MDAVTEDTVNEAAKILQTLSFTTLLIVLSAYIFLYSNEPNMAEYQSARQLSAWLAMNKLALSLSSRGTLGTNYQLNWAVTGSCAEQNSGVGSVEAAKCFDRICDIANGYPEKPGVWEESCHRIAVTALWPKLRVFEVSLRRVFGPALTTYTPAVRVEDYEVVFKGDHGSLPFSAYTLVRLIPTDDSRSTDRDDMKLDSERWQITTIGPGPDRPTDRDGEPIFWDQTSEFLRAFGNKAAAAPPEDELAINSFFAHATGEMSGAEIFGMHLDTPLYISGVGFLLGAVSLAMYAPLTALKRGRNKNVEPLWILFIYTGNNLALERLLLALSVALAISPLGIVYMQFRLFHYIYPGELGGKFILLLVGGICLVWSTWVLASLAFEAWFIRRRGRIVP